MTEITTGKFVLVAVAFITGVLVSTSYQREGRQFDIETSFRGIRYGERLASSDGEDGDDDDNGNDDGNDKRTQNMETTSNLNNAGKLQSSKPVTRGNNTFDKDNCTLDRKFMPPGSMPVIVLYSVPGSGNTWVRLLLERSSGIYSGSVYSDKGSGNSDDSYFRKSDPCSGTTIVVKSHTLSAKQLQKCGIDGAVFLIRNPYGAGLAEFNRRKSGKTGTAELSDFKKWNKFVSQFGGKWFNNIHSGLQKVSNHMIVYYEDLLLNTEHELRRLLTFLNVQPDERRIQCILKENTGNYKRKHKNLKLNPFTAKLNETIDKNIKMLRELMESEYGYNLPLYESI
ncbi:sialate:O-sulfotransferase 1-like isoform X2 [Apostichopus japonicus]|uniref:sialate:O-sulfotransferase 1-like isoform X2 n=1 Tax=Stichopus japonicus TaxID=307972 RepID=UPI003AB4B907